MRNSLEHLSRIAITLWVGGLWITSIWAYVLFKTLADHQLAGQLAGQLFNILSIIGMVCAGYLLLYRLGSNGFQAFKHTYFWAVLIMLALVLLGHYYIQPMIAQLKHAALPANVMQSRFADAFNMWHSIASVVYMVECVLGVIALVKK